MPKAKIVSFINYKGGVGKTTTTYHVGCALAQYHSKKVLFVDIDPQTNLTFLCAPYDRWAEFKKRAGTIANLYDAFLSKKSLDTKRFTWREPIQYGRGQVNNLDLIPCDVELLGEDLGGGNLWTSGSLELLKENAREFLRARSFLRNALRVVEDKYDYILIDCPPNLYLMTQNALTASHWYVITAIPDHLSTIGLNILQQKVERIGELLKRAGGFSGDAPEQMKVARLGGVVFVKVRIGGMRLVNTHAGKMEEINTLLKGKCFETHTTELIGYSEAAENSLPVWLHSSDNARRAASKREYEKITEEFLRRT